MYPKVKVRVQDLDDDLSFSWSLMSSPGEYQVDSPKCVIRVPTAQILKQQLHLIQEPKVIDQKDNICESTDRSSSRATSVVRPRAVLSSPDNDEMIGSKNSKRVIQPSPLQNHNRVQKEEVEQKSIPLLSTMKTPVGTRNKVAYAANTHTPFTVDSLSSITVAQKSEVGQKIIPIISTTKTPVGTSNKVAYAVNDHTPSTTDSFSSIKGKPRRVNRENDPTRSTNNSSLSIKGKPKIVNAKNDHTHSTLESMSNIIGKPKTANAVSNHIPSMVNSLHNIKRKPKSVKDQTLSKVKQLGIVASSQKEQLKTQRAGNIV